VGTVEVAYLAQFVALVIRDSGLYGSSGCVGKAVALRIGVQDKVCWSKSSGGAEAHIDGCLSYCVYGGGPKLRFSGLQHVGCGDFAQCLIWGLQKLGCACLFWIFLAEIACYDLPHVYKIILGGGGCLGREGISERGRLRAPYS